MDASQIYLPIIQWNGLSTLLHYQLLTEYWYTLWRRRSRRRIKEERGEKRGRK